MNDQDYIREAVELAEDDFFKEMLPVVGEEGYEDADRRFFDALAAQLVRQVDKTTKCGMADIAIHRLDRKYSGDPIDRPMEDIRDIIDLGLLSPQDKHRGHDDCASGKPRPGDSNNG